MLPLMRCARCSMRSVAFYHPRLDLIVPVVFFTYLTHGLLRGFGRPPHFPVGRVHSVSGF
jgi:hypothetical protein